MKLPVILLLLLCTPVWAAQYKCQIGNTIEYRDSPCPAGTERAMQNKPQMDTSPAKRDEALKRLEADKQRAQTLERARLEKEATEQKKASDAVASKKEQEAAQKKGSEVTPEEGAKQGAAGRTYQQERSKAQPLPTPKK